MVCVDRKSVAVVFYMSPTHIDILYIVMSAFKKSNSWRIDLSKIGLRTSTSSQKLFLGLFKIEKIDHFHVSWNFPLIALNTQYLKSANGFITKMTNKSQDLLFPKMNLFINTQITSSSFSDQKI